MMSELSSKRMTERWKGPEYRAMMSDLALYIGAYDGALEGSPDSSIEP
jgi:hypothetical protein